MSSYLLTYDVSTAAPIEAQLLAFVKANRLVTQWSYPYAGLFLLKSTADIWTLAASFRDFFADEHNHVIVPVSGSTSQGILPNSVWTWLNTPETQPLAGLLSQYSSGEISS